MTAPLRKVAYERFKSRLFDRTLTPGSFVTQRQLCDLLDSPMGAVREALKRLEAEGLINLLPQRGVQIADINIKFINESFQFRLLIEQEAARRMARAPMTGCLGQLLERTSELRARALDASDEDADLLAEGLQVDLELHALLVATFRNSLIADTYQNIEDRVRLIRSNGAYSAGRLAVAMEEHVEIIRAILSGDEGGTVEALTAHLTTSRRRALGEGEIGL
ncbi:MAG: GntR family transcriptional regulator [Rhodobacter sp.]|nr:GntR family transcriptional regulator [Rhodobacter sp.]MCY4166766.1 GntR family transcriptional regulator [Rhodobacter sp.]MCY4243639.1 GntR family transcriptional regulator [Rhodobacter sp.]